MPKYLTINDDLQLVTGEGCRFLSKSGKDLEAVETDVENWVENNASHARREEAERWLNSVSDEMRRRLSIEDQQRIERAAIDAVQKSIRQYFRATGRSKGWSREKILQIANRGAEMVLNVDSEQ
jgi:hypothetical protein